MKKCLGCIQCGRVTFQRPEGTAVMEITILARVNPPENADAEDEAAFWPVYHGVVPDFVIPGGGLYQNPVTLEAVVSFGEADGAEDTHTLTSQTGLLLHEDNSDVY